MKRETEDRERMGKWGKREKETEEVIVKRQRMALLISIN